MEEYVTRLEAVLSGVVNARDSQTVKQATDELSKVWYKQPETVPALVRILQVHPQAQMRQLAGVEVRKLLPRFWYEKEHALSPEVMEQIKASLLSESRKEDSDLVRHTVARIISAIARLDLDENRWPQLLPELQRAAVASDVREREIAIYVLYALLDSQDYSAAAADRPQEMLQLFSRTIKDPESLIVRVNTVLALAGLSAGLSGGEAQVFQQFVPEIVQVLQQTVAASDDKSSKLIFESLSELIDADAALLGTAFGDLLTHMVTDYGLNTAVDPDTRVAAMRVVSTATSFRFNRINKLKLGPTLTKQLVQVIANECAEEDEDEEDAEEDEDLTVQASALQSLETLSTRLPPSQVIAPLLHMLPELVHTSKPSFLRAGYLAFSATADGAPDFVASETEILLPWIVAGLQNGQQSVRVAALYALCQLGDSVGERVGREHATLVPLVYAILDSASSIKVCRSACYALATILRTLKNEVLSTTYLPGLVPRLLEVVASSPNLELKGFVISTIGTAAEAAGQNFLPYFEQTMKTLEPFVAMPAPNPATGEIEPAAARLVSEALGTLSRLCCAIGAERFAPYLEAWMKTALSCLTSKDPNLREMAPLYISELAEVYRGDFGVYVAHIVPHLFDVLAQEEITYDDLEALGDAVRSGDADLEDIEAADLTDGLKVNSALCIEKEYTLDCLGSLWQYVPADPAMLPFLQPSLEQFREQTEHFYEEVRNSALTGLWRMFQALPANQEVKDATWSATAEILETETDMGVVSTLLELIGETVKTVGGLAPVFADANAVELVLTNVLEIVSKTHRVFDEFADDEAEDGDDQEAAGEESSESAAHLVQTSLELLSRIAAAMGAEFAPLFEKVAAALQPYATSQIDSERETGVGAFADLVGAMEAHVTPWTSVLMQAFAQALGDSAIGVRSVAAYGVGLLAASSTDEQTVQAAYPEILDKLAQLLSTGTDDRAVANGAGAVARLALRYPQAVPIPAPQLAEQLLTVLPLKDAFEEYPPILQFLSTTQCPAAAKPVFEELWKQHLDAQAKDAIKSVNYLPADDPLGNDVAMQAWRACAQQVGI